MSIAPLSLALIELWIANPALPWSNPLWQSLTHIPGDPWAYYDHVGGIIHVAEWTIDKAQAAKAFMNNCRMAEDPAERYAVKEKNYDHEGRSTWGAWVRTSWAKWNIKKLVNHILEESGCEPHYVMERMNLKCNTTDDFPTIEAAQVRGAVSVKLADALFGDDAITDGSFIVPSNMTFIGTLLVLTWSRYRKVIKQQDDRMTIDDKEVKEQCLAWSY
ncbi:hypothetical protein BDR04DRAFT_1184379 [Suillus decipiens]|nr:hypothetical protein BDR04DRAFT_1184379 [Suillus decipiens]